MGALALMLSTSAVFAGSAPISPPRSDIPDIQVTPDRSGKRLIDRATAIERCVVRVRDFNEGQYVKWIEENEEELGDLAHQLRKDKYPNWRELMIGAAISICMPRKGYYNTCVSQDGNMDGDLQTIETARIPTCWTQGKRAEKQKEKEIVIIQPEPPVIRPEPPRPEPT